jgi:hypothetical protein
MSKTGERETLSTWLDAHDAALVRARARAADRTVAAEIRQAMRGYFGRTSGDAADECQQVPSEPSLPSAA